MSDAAYEGRHALLPDVDGDEGLNEACRLWWLTESFTLTLTATADSNTETSSFQRPSFPAPASRCSLEGQLALPNAAGGIVWAYSTTPEPTWGPDPTSGAQVVGIRYAQDVSRWCLVLSQYVTAYATTDTTTVTAGIGGPGPFNYDLSGTYCEDEFGGPCFEHTRLWTRTLVSNLSILGYSFPLYKEMYFDNQGMGLGDTPPSNSVSGSSSSTFYTLE